MNKTAPIALLATAVCGVASVWTLPAETVEQKEARILSALKGTPSATEDPRGILVNKPDYVVFVPKQPRDPAKRDPSRPGDTYNDHFQVISNPSNGYLYAFWTQASREADVDQHIAFSRSRDKGLSWSEPVVLAGSPNKRNPALLASWQQPMLASSGRLYCLWNQQTTSRGPHCGMMFGAFSDDDGATWSAPKLVPFTARMDADPKDPLIPPSWCNWQRPLRLGEGGRYFVGCSRHGKAPYDERYGCKIEFWEFQNIDLNPRVEDIRLKYFSTNTSALSAANLEKTGGFRASEPALEEAAPVKLPDGRLFAMMRSSVGSPVWVESRDGGRSWSAPKILRDSAGKPFLHPRSPCPLYDWKGPEAASGTYFALVHQMFDFKEPKGNAYQRRGPLYLIAGRFDPTGEQPIRFAAPKLFAPRENGNSFYTSYAIVDGKGVLWYNDMKFYLCGRVIGPEWFDESANELPPPAMWTRYATGTNSLKTVIKYEKPDRRPIWFGADCRAENVGGGGDCCFFLDLIEEGGEEWAVRVDFTHGTHGAEHAERVFTPARPVKEIQCFLMLRHATGCAWFERPFLRRAMPPAGHVVSSVRRTLRPHAENDLVDADVSDGTRVIAEKRREKPAIHFANPLAKDVVAVWTADSMRRVSPLAFPTAAELRAVGIDLELARGERESAQICVSTGDGATASNVTVCAGALAAADGTAFPGTVTVQRIGYLARRRGYFPHSLSPDARETWFAEPLLPNAPVTVTPGSTRGAWLTVFAPRDAKPGVYLGAVEVAANGKTTAVPVSVRVRAFALPETFGLKTAYSVMDGFTRAAYPNDELKARRRETWAIMLDHRLNPDDISRTTPPDLDDLVYARSRGMSSFNVLNLVPPPKDPKSLWVCWSPPDEVFSAASRAYFERTLKPYVAELKKRGLDRYAYLYGFDERGREFYPQMLEFCRQMREMTSLPVMTTAYMFRDTAAKKLAFDSPYATMTDWHCPLSSVYDASLAERYRAKGKQVWFYTCCGPTEPHMNNASYEYPLVECRLIGWLVNQQRADGFLFWHVNFWPKGGKLDERETFFPDWNTYSGLHMPGDGVFLYPGRERVLAGIRLANVRDGVEDYEWLQLAERTAGRAAVEAVLKKVVRGSSDFTRETAVIRAARRALGDLCE